MNFSEWFSQIGQFLNDEESNKRCISYQEFWAEKGWNAGFREAEYRQEMRKKDIHETKFPYSGSVI